nr:retrovirus-related Pol polyprotein from transposon TNT 1-94 [Tanacetum cinerariifolium]
MFDANHDLCALEFFDYVNVHSKSKSAKSSKKKNIWKPTGKVNIDIGYRWKPTRLTFTIDGNVCPLTRITSTKVAPLKENTSKSAITQNSETEVPYSDTYQHDVINQSVPEMSYFEQTPIVDYPDNEITSDSNIIPNSQYLHETQHAVVQDSNSSTQQDSMIISMFKKMSEQISNQVTNWDKANQETKTVNESLIAELERYKERDRNALKQEINSLKKALSKHVKENESLLQTFTVFKKESKEKERKSANLELKLKHQKESFLTNRSLNNQNAHKVLQFFKINEWQARLDTKDVSIAKLKQHVKNLKGKNVVENDATPNNAKVIALGMFKIDLEPLSPKVLSNMDAHIDYIKHSQEHVDTLREIVKHTRALKPLDSDLDSTCKIVKQIQEVLVYVKATCPSLTKHSKKLVAFTPLNKNRKLGLQNLPHHHVTLKNRSQSSDNTKNNRISRTTSNNMQNKSSKKKNIWKPTGKVNIDIGYRWKPTRLTFTIDGNMCPLTRITSTKVAPLKENTSKLAITQNSEKPLLSAHQSQREEFQRLDGSFYCRFVEIENQIPFDHSRINSQTSARVSIRASLGHDPEAVATACFTQNRSLICKRHNKTPYELLHNKKPDLSYLHVFGALCYPTNDNEDLGKLKPKIDIGIFVGCAPAKKAYRIYNKRTRLIVKTLHVDFDELTAMASEQISSGLGP